MVPAGAGTRSVEIAIRTGVIDRLALPGIRPSGQREFGQMTPFHEEELKRFDRRVVNEFCSDYGAKRLRHTNSRDASSSPASSADQILRA
jgi:hypothetical protein